MYVLALLIIAALTTGAHLTFQNHVSSSNGLHAMNTAGRQRTMSELVRNDAYSAAYARDAAARGRALDRLALSTREITSVHDSLRNGNPVLGLDPAQGTLLELYDELGPTLQAMLGSVDRLSRALDGAERAPGDSGAEAQLALAELRRHQPRFLSQMELIVARHELELQQASASVQGRSAILLISTLITLLLVAAFVFEPAVRAVRRQFERAESLRIRAEDGARAKSQFLTSMSHEIRTPMAAILGYAEMVEDTRITSGERATSLETLRRSGSHLLGLIEDLLDLSRAEAGQMRICANTCSPREIVADAAAMMRLRADSKGVRLNVRINDAVPEHAVIDAARTRQILVNLVGNAVKFTDAGSVHVSVTADERDGERTLAFIVADTGPGMSPQALSRIFEPFARAHDAGAPRREGTGLGLTISRSLAEKLGGEIFATSTLGEGSRFELRIPYNAAPEVNVSDAPSENSEDHAEPGAADLTGRVLLADDSVDNRRLINLYLTRAGAEVDEAADGAQVCDMVRLARENGRPYGVILMDLQMPVMDGLDATRAIRGMGVVTPILALTASGEQEHRDRCEAAGCDGFLSKPIDQATLVRICAWWMGKRHTRRSAA